MHIVELPQQAIGAIASLVADYLRTGQGLDWFRARLKRICEEHDLQCFGYTDRDRFARNSRYLAASFSAQVIRATKLADLRLAGYPLWVFHACADPAHAHLDGLYLPPSHGFWRVFIPPLGVDCGCHLSGARSERSAERLGGDPEKWLRPGWDDIDPASGAPLGVEPGWGTEQGPSFLDILAIIRNDLVPET